MNVNDNHTGNHSVGQVKNSDVHPFSGIDPLSGIGALPHLGGSGDWNGIRTSLAEMEKRLGELQEQVDPTQHRGATHGGEMHHTIMPVPDTTPAAQAQVALVRQQIEDLLRVRELLRDSLRTALTDCERALGRLERGEPAGAASPAAQIACTASAGGPPVAVGELAVSFAPRPSVYQGNVSLRVGPLSDISQVDTLEIALLQVPGAEQVEIKEFAGHDAVADIRLFQPVRLVEELHRVLPFSFEVIAGDASTLTLRAAVPLASAGAGASAPFAADAAAGSEASDV